MLVPNFLLLTLSLFIYLPSLLFFLSFRPLPLCRVAVFRSGFSGLVLRATAMFVSAGVYQKLEVKKKEKKIEDSEKSRTIPLK